MTGVSSCLITDRSSEMVHLFVPDEEGVTSSPIDECIEKVNYLLDNESVRIEIAKKGKTRTLKDHTVMNRCTEVNKEE